MGHLQVFVVFADFHSDWVSSHLSSKPGHHLLLFLLATTVLTKGDRISIEF